MQTDAQALRQIYGQINKVCLQRRENCYIAKVITHFPIRGAELKLSYEKKVGNPERTVTEEIDKFSGKNDFWFNRSNCNLHRAKFAGDENVKILQGRNNTRAPGKVILEWKEGIFKRNEGPEDCIIQTNSQTITTNCLFVKKI